MTAIITAKQIKLAAISKRMGLSLTLTVALPATVEVIAKNLGMTEDQVINHLENNEPMREYVKDVLVSMHSDIAEIIR